MPNRKSVAAVVAPIVDVLPWERQENETAEAYRAFLMYRDMGVKRSLRVLADRLVPIYAQQHADEFAEQQRNAAQLVALLGPNGEQIHTDDAALARAGERSEPSVRRRRPKLDAPQPTPTSLSLFNRVGVWSRGANWPERCRLWEVQQQRIADAQKVEGRERLKKDHSGVSRTLLQAAVRLAQPPAELLQPGNEAKLAAWRPHHQDLRAASDGINNAIRNERLSFDMPTEITRAEVLLKEQIKEATEVNAVFLRILQELLCDECRDRAYAELERAARLHEQTAASVAAL